MKQETLRLISEALEAQSRAILALAEEAAGNSFLTVEDYSEKYRLHPDTVRSQCRLGILQGIKKGKRWMVEDKV